MCEIVFLEEGVKYHPYLINSDSFCKNLDYVQYLYLQGTKNGSYCCKSLRKTTKELRITVTNNTDNCVKILERELTSTEYEYFIDNFQKDFENVCKELDVTYSTQDFIPH